MNKLFFYLFIKPFSRLPLSVIYGITWPFYLLTVHVIRYRKKVVLENLTNSFPEKSPKEIRGIKNQFYRHLFDQLMELVRMISMPEKESLERCKIVNSEILDPFYAEGRNIAFVMGHYNNWEYTFAMNAQMKHQYVAIYSPLKNSFVNQIMYDARSKMETKLVSKNSMGAFIRAGQAEPYMLMFASDQSPSRESRIHWMSFLNQHTAVATGTERCAKMFDMPVVFGYIDKVKRGHYEVTLEVLSNQPKSEPEGKITELHVKALEKQIIKNPQYWLWTHKRWKKKWG